MPGQDDDVYTLHIFPFSLYSIMARLAVNIGQSLSSKDAPKIELQLVNMHQSEHYSEAYLTKVSAKGQVPSLTSPSLPEPITDSKDIALWLIKQQPELVPQQHRDAIMRLFEEVYAFHAKALCVPADQRKGGVPNEAAAKLKEEGLSEEWRQALEKKSAFHESFHGGSLESDRVASTYSKAEVFLEDLAAVIQQRKGPGPWIFGDKPTIIDAHAAALINRLLDVNNITMLSQELQAYGKAVAETQEWQETTHGRRTNWKREYGSVADFNPF